MLVRFHKAREKRPGLCKAAQSYNRVLVESAQTAEEVRALMARGAYWDAAAAQRAGFVDEIARPEARVLRFPRRIGFRADT